MPNDEIWSHLFTGIGGRRRFTQDSPVLPDVWAHFLDPTRGVADLLLTPWRSTTPSELVAAAQEVYPEPAPIGPERRGARHVGPIGYFVSNETFVAVRMAFEDVATFVVPFSGWWQQRIARHIDTIARLDRAAQRSADRKALLRSLAEPGSRHVSPLPPQVVWWIRVLGTVSSVSAGAPGVPSPEVQLRCAATLSLNGQRVGADRHLPLLFSVALDRSADASVVDSRRTLKADAATRVFEVDCSSITWAVVDSGIDFTHPAFADRGTQPAGPSPLPRTKKTARASAATKQAAARRARRASRVRAVFDFTRLRRLLELTSSPHEADQDRVAREFHLNAQDGRQLVLSIRQGRQTDWKLLAGALEPANARAYVSSLNPHGTHVAGILGGDPPERDVQTALLATSGERAAVGAGICTDIQLYDLRALDAEGRGTEFDIIAALQFVRHLNTHSKKPVVHGVNLSFSIPHDVSLFASGRTPICVECDRLVSSGIVVVTAAGNLGVDRSSPSIQITGGAAYRNISITDPGNTQSVITVGSTHRKRPHEYGVSYFSSRGPTGDGRRKPDVVAPGEKIVSCVPHGAYDTMEGTSQAAPHVSGAAAMLMARHEELIGQPERIKQILCETATDLGRERDFQGHGLVDVLRAIQSV